MKWKSHRIEEPKGRSGLRIINKGNNHCAAKVNIIRMPTKRIVPNPNVLPKSYFVFSPY